MANLGLQNNNPGNLRDPATGNFRVFNTPEEGHKALINDISIKQSGKSSVIKPGASISDFANVWAPSSDNNNPQNYAHTLATNLGVDVNHPFDQVDPEKLAGAIKVAEGTSTMPSSPTTKLSVQDFAAKIRSKYNAYQNVDDKTLTDKFIAKYPVYKDRVDTSTTGQTQTQNTQTELPQPHPDLLKQVGNIANTLFPGKQVGESIGTLAGYIQAKINDAVHGTDTASHYDTSSPTVLQTAADIGQGALMVGSVPGVSAGGSALARMGIAGAEGAAFGGLNAVAGGSTDIGEIGKQAAIGGVVGGATSGLIEGGMAAYKGLSGLAKGGARTAEEILATPAEKIGELSAREQKLWHENVSREAISKADLAGKEAIAEADRVLTEGQKQLGTMTKETAETFKQPAQDLLKKQSQEYLALSGELADKSPALEKTITQSNLVSKIESKFEYNPEIAASLKSDLGLDVAKTGEEEMKLTNQEILDKARAIMQDVGKTARQGNRVYSADEYQAMQKYSFLMETLGDNGVDMKAANEFWKKWAPLRDKIVTQVKPWDETGIKGTPLARTLVKSSQPANTAIQAISKAEAQTFISQFEEALNIPKGSMTSKSDDLVRQLEELQSSKEQTKEAIKTELAQLRQDIKNKKYDLSNKAKKEARIRAIIGKIIKIGAGAFIGGKVGGVAGEGAGMLIGSSL